MYISLNVLVVENSPPPPRKSQSLLCVCVCVCGAGGGVGEYGYFLELHIVCEVEAHSFKFAMHVSDDQHPLSVANINEPLVDHVI